MNASRGGMDRQKSGGAAYRLKISKQTVDDLEPGAARRIWWDTALPGFGVEVMPTGAKSYRLAYRHRGRARLLTLGRHGSITPAEAREMAKKALGRIAEGLDPGSEKTEARRALPLQQAFEDWLTTHCAAKLKPTTSAEYRRLFETNIKPTLGARPLAEVSRADVAELHRRLAPSPYIANRVVAVLRSFFTWTERHGLRSENSNPARLVVPFRERRRERILSADDLARLGAALDESTVLEGPWALAAIRLLIFTGARRGEILNLRWSEVDLHAGFARLPDSKTGVKTLYLPRAAREIIAELPRVDGNPFVIAGHRRGAALVGLSKVWRRVRARAGLDDLRIHDLRHAFASSAAVDGVPLIVIGRLLGHSQPSVTDRYAHLSSSPLVEAADQIAGPIADKLRGRS